MINNKIFSRNFLLVWIAILFVSLHLFGLEIPYHQDEYKWVYYSHTEVTASGTIPHPPLTEFIYTKLGPIVGDNNFRSIPFAFGFVNLFLIFYLAKIIFDSKTAVWSAFLFTVSFYSLLASLMVDVDGTVLPFFFLISAISYHKLRKENFKLRESGWKWLLLFIIGVVGGVLVKMSGVLPLAAFLIDFSLLKGFFSDRKRFLKFIGLSMLAAIGIVAALLLAKLVFPFFPIGKSITYWKHFADSSSFLGRGWFQVAIQFLKAILYTSPLLIFPAFFSDIEIWRKTRVFYLFIFVGLIFYLFAFDFSLGALDRYFQFLVVPLCIIAGGVFAKIFGNKDTSLKKVDFICIFIITVSISTLQLFDQFVPPLYPKAEWLSRALHLKWNFLFPFSGGSGPLGFYVSFIFIALVWLVSFIFSLSFLKFKNAKKQALFCILVLGLLYNAMFTEEYLFGRLNGNAKNLVQRSVAHISQNQEITNVAVYNDNGGYEIRQSGKYARRIYAAPQFEETYEDFFKDFSGHILYIDVPRIGENNYYSDYFSKCSIIYKDKDKYISALILDCRNNLNQ